MINKICLVTCMHHIIIFFRGSFVEIVWYLYSLCILHVYLSYIFKYWLNFLIFINITIQLLWLKSLFSLSNNPKNQELWRALWHSWISKTPTRIELQEKIRTSRILQECKAQPPAQLTCTTSKIKKRTLLAAPLGLPQSTPLRNWPAQ